jgi:hypothetical protein
VNNWNNITNSQSRVRKKSFGGTFCFSNCHIIRLDTGGLVFLVSGSYIVAIFLVVNFYLDNLLLKISCLYRILIFPNPRIDIIYSVIAMALYKRNANTETLDYKD